MGQNVYERMGDCMNRTIDEQLYTCRTDIRDDPVVRESWNALAMRTFGLDFSGWHRAGYWDDRYQPHVLLRGSRVVSCVAVNRLTMVLDGERQSWIQLGTVMTDEQYRGRGLAAFLMERVLEEWRGHCDAICLFANDSARDFYPRFDFVPAEEYRTRMTVTGRSGHCRRLDMDRTDDRARLLAAYRRSNPFSALRIEDTPGLLMFYCDGPLRDCIYALEEADAVAVAEQTGDGLLCYDVFGGETASLAELLAPLAGEGTKTVQLGFSPARPVGERSLSHTEDETLFFLGESGRRFSERRLTLPLLAHT